MSRKQSESEKIFNTVVALTEIENEKRKKTEIETPVETQQFKEEVKEEIKEKEPNIEERFKILESKIFDLEKENNSLKQPKKISIEQIQSILQAKNKILEKLETFRLNKIKLDSIDIESNDFDSKEYKISFVQTGNNAPFLHISNSFIINEIMGYTSVKIDEKIALLEQELLNLDF